MDERTGLRDVLSETELTLLVELLDEIVPGSGAGAAGYLERRVTAGRLDPEGIRGALTGSRSSSTQVRAWSGAEPGTVEAGWFETLRAWAWEAYLCDPGWGGNSEEQGWHRFGYRGRPKTEPGVGGR